jgi:thiamine pyrophosphokinase
MSKRKICHIFGAGDESGVVPEIRQGDYVIAADAGFLYSEKCGIKPDMIIGDFDSLGKIPKGNTVIILPQMKDETDMAAAIKEGEKQNCEIFRIYGGTGGRLDHTLANIQCLAELAQRALRGYLYDNASVITAIHNDCISFPEEASGTVSVFAHSDIAEKVCEKGLKYELDNAKIKNTFPLGVSNEFTGARSTISVKNGTLIIIYPAGTEEVSE